MRILRVVPARGGSKGVARTAGALVPFPPSAELTRDTTPTEHVVRHAIAVPGRRRRHAAAGHLTAAACRHALPLLDPLVRGAVATAVGGNPEILPGAAMTAHDNHSLIAGVVAEQGLDPASRPPVTAAWPECAARRAEAAEVYRAGAGRS